MDEKLSFNANGGKVWTKIAEKGDFFGCIAIGYVQKYFVQKDHRTAHYLLFHDSAQLDRIQKLQNRIENYHKKRRTDGDEMLSELNWMSAKRRINIQVMMFISKVSWIITSGKLLAYLYRSYEEQITDFVNENLKENSNYLQSISFISAIIV